MNHASRVTSCVLGLWQPLGWESHTDLLGSPPGRRGESGRRSERPWAVEALPWEHRGEAESCRPVSELHLTFITHQRGLWKQHSVNICPLKVGEFALSSLNFALLSTEYFHISCTRLPRLLPRAWAASIVFARLPSGRVGPATLMLPWLIIS